MKTLIDVSVTNTIKLINDLTIFALWSCADGKRLSPSRTAVSNAVGTANDDQVSQSAVSKMVKEANVQMVAQSEIISMMAGELTKSDKLMFPTTKFVAKTVKQKAGKDKFLKKQKQAIQVIALSPPSPDPSGYDSSKKKIISMRVRRGRKNQKRRESPSPSNSD